MNDNKPITFVISPQTRDNLANLMVRKCTWNEHFEDIYEFIMDRIDDWVNTNTRVMRREEEKEENEEL